ncbi:MULTISPECIES: MFS transporter [Acinetobacter]|jgi:predicted MFS family arabinose efflux permease|uniref:MFS transporter n=2 Tax=Acinetobacter johnsonii TaxID=40214 RepID=A0A2W5CEN3_ACIJO|nr:MULTISPECIES: MFS transporter [Acinetobacter]MDA0776226.1 MFS transporter [Pseudomonadota bacterium]MDN5444307.1 MFS transporter [Pseudomonadales bacterium]NWK62708.1 MFS transporter [Acinetobacter sp. SwsAc3]OFW77827.1 MAG: MFS transporter [Acinetobacter sp. RIFCSPHIGHO2_12_41_5]OHC25236.1 MAG: MFS transporter [Pseudomonadales bacterium RIFCSPHIGHO2_12_FULL_40_16]OYW70702.1 MAG: MFS transporter [Pseudomonadales bacterium 32-42-5]PPE76977.1 MFS transporter [Kaistia algarum]
MMNALERRSTFALSSIFALRMLGLFMIIPVFSVAGQTYEYATPALLGLAVGIYGLTQAILQIPFSLIADRYSRKPLVVFGLLLFALGGAIAAMSDTIYGVIIGRAIAGGGAVSAVVMALLADVTREENRMKAMATMGMSIGVSFAVAFSLGPWLTGLVGISGLFWVTTIMGLAAISMLFLVPKVTRHHRNYQQGYLAQLKQVLKMGDLNRLHVSVFSLHLLLTAMFIYVPSQLIDFAKIPLNSHGWVYLPLLVISLFFAFPSIVLAEKYRKMRGIFLTAIGGIILGLGILIFGFESKYILLTGLGLFFIAFNVMEALLPSWLSKAAPIQSKATAMGVNASSQFLGAFFGGVTGGQLLLLNNTALGWSILTGLAIVWLLISFGLAQPRYLSSMVLRLPEHKQTDEWTSQLLAIRGIEEVVVMSDQQVAYVKVDKQQIDDATRQDLTQLLGKEVAI